jgi:biotin carboxylase
MSTQTYRAGEFLVAAERLGLPVAVGSEQAHVLSKGNPGGHLALDFNDLEGATDRIVAFAEAYPVDAIVSTDDDGVLLAGMASGALGLKHNSLLSVQRARDKYQTRVALSDAGLRTPEFRRYSIDDDPHEIARQVPYPCVVKPLALAASRGVMRTDDPDQFVVAFDRLVEILRGAGLPPASDVVGQMLVESYIPGLEVAVEGILNEGDLAVLALFDKPDPLEGPYFEETIFVTPSRHPQAMQQAIVEETRRAIAALGLTEGPIHAELRVNEAGPWIIEVAPRSIGGYCSRCLRFGIDTTLEDLILEQATGQSLSATQLSTPASGVMMIPIPAKGVLCEVHGLTEAEQVEGIDEIRITIPIGGQVVPVPEGAQYLGFIFSRRDTPEAVEAALREAHQRLRFVIQLDD